MRQTLAGKTVLVTGAARGLGEGLAEACVERGAQVALLGLEPERLQTLARRLGTDRAASWHVDVTDGDALDSAVAEAAAYFGGLDVAVANAGVTAFGPVVSLDPAVFERVLAINLTGVWRTLRAAQPHVQARAGYLLSIASMAAVMRSPLQAHYTASKAAVAALTQSLRLELKGTGTRVGTAYLTFVKTDMMRHTTADPVGALIWKGNTGGLNRMITPKHAVDALVHGIERRSARIVAPRHLLPAVLAPGYIEPLFANQFRPKDIRRAIAASSPTGWGTTTQTTNEPNQEAH